MTPDLRERLARALAKPISDHDGCGPSTDEFDPWHDVIEGIYGSYSSESDRLMIAALIAVRDAKTFDFIDREGFAGEFMLYVLAGHGYLEYGTSPRGGWWDHELAGTLEPLIEKWTAHASAAWGEATP